MEFSETIPIFPLDNVVIFPNTYLPLNIFEKRYLNMINKAIASESRLIGMIQPIKPNNRQVDFNFHKVGCAGKIIKFEETEDNRYLVTLKGLTRFNLISEKTNQDNFIIGKVDWNIFNQDLKKESVKESFTNLKIVLKKFLKSKNIRVNMDVIDACDDYNLVDQVTMICPFSSEEKQLLLETHHLSKRSKLLLSIMESYTNEVNISDIIKH